MTTSPADEPNPQDDPWLDLRPEDLPPVEPPSAGFIVQLFVVPLLIVAVVIGIYVLFGQLATAEQDWRQLVTDVKSENPHVKWRGALGLAQMLDLDARRGEAGQKLTENRDIAAALSELYGKLSSIANPTEEELQQVEFLSKALGQLKVDDVVLPILQQGADVTHDPDIRKHSLTGIALVAGRAFEKKRALKAPGLVDNLIEISQEQTPLSRHQAAFILGLIDDPRGRERLEVLLQDGDQMVRLNAAIGLARSGSVLGVPAFEELFAEAPDWKLDPTHVSTPEQESEYFEKNLMLLNSLRALDLLKSDLSAPSREQLKSDLERLLQSTGDAVLRAETQKVIHEL